MTPIPGPELVRRQGVTAARQSFTDSPHGESRFGRWLSGWLFGQQGITGSASQVPQMLDPRSPQGLINLASIVSGNPEDISAKILPFARPVATGGEIVNRAAAQPILASLGATRNTYELPLTARMIGPRRVGGIYRSGYSGEAYRVNAIHAGPNGNFSISVETVPEPGRPNFGARTHMTGWEAGRDQVLYQPPGSSGPAEASRTAALNAILEVLGSHSARDLRSGLLNGNYNHRQ